MANVHDDAEISPELLPNRGSMRRHLDWLVAPAIETFPDLRVEIAWGTPEGGPNQGRTFRLDQLADAVAHAARVNEAGNNVYVGALLKRADTPAMGRTRAEHAAMATALAVDFDTNAKAGVVRLTKIAPPQLIVGTGSTPEKRVQVWIRLEPTEDLALWDEVNHRSVSFCGGDRFARGRYRLMRLAGSVNYPSAAKQERRYTTERTRIKFENAPAYILTDLLVKFPGNSSNTSGNVVDAFGPTSVGGLDLPSNIPSNVDRPPPPVEEMRAALQHLADKGYFKDRDGVVKDADGRIIGVGWRETGMALKLAYGDKVGFDLWGITHIDNRARKDAPAQWKSFASELHPDHVTIATVIKAAKDAGFVFKGDATSNSRASTGASSLPLNVDEMNALVENAASDPGLPFEKAMLARLVVTKRADLAAFMRLRTRLRANKIKVTELDKALDAIEAADDDEDRAGQGRGIEFPEIEPWPEPVDGAGLLDTIIEQLKQYVMMPDEAAIAVALWVVHAYCFEAFTTSPRLVITSPEKRCGKTTLLRVVQALTPRPLPAANITAAAMFRTIENYRPTLLIDEADTFVRDNEELRGIINSGHESEGRVIRLVGDDNEPRAFSTFSPTVIAAIGSLASTIEDRAIMIAMRRRLATEQITRLRIDRAEHLHALARKIARWVADQGCVLSGADPVMPVELNDRACDNWRLLFAIADLAGGEWPEKARSAALMLAAQSAAQDNQSRGVILLADIRRIFDDRQAEGRPDADRISSTELATALELLSDRPWGTWSRGKPITTVAIARILKDFSIAPNTIKVAGGRQPNGYKRSQFDDAFGRYLPSSSVFPVQSSPSSPKPCAATISGQTQSSPAPVRGELEKVPQTLSPQQFGEGGEPSSRQLPGRDDIGEPEDLDDLELGGCWMR
jgi:hypothetical protein